MNIKQITPSSLEFALVEKSQQEDLKKRDVAGVPSRFFLSSRDILMGYGFSRCQAVVLLNPLEEFGAMLHNHPQDCPSAYIEGHRKEKDKAINPREEFEDLSRVKAFHIYHEENHSYPTSWVERPLTEIGVKSVSHIPILSSVPGKNYWMDVVLDVKNKRLYVFPTDFDNGIMLKLN
jgi:hypothetical protein